MARNRFSWRANVDYDLALLSQVEILRPFGAKDKAEAGRIWSEVADNLKSCHLQMSVTARSCKARTRLLTRQLNRVAEAEAGADKAKEDQESSKLKVKQAKRSRISSCKRAGTGTPIPANEDLKVNPFLNCPLSTSPTAETAIFIVEDEPDTKGLANPDLDQPSIPPFDEYLDTPEARFQCAHCSKKYSASKQLIKHELIHNIVGRERDLKNKSPEIEDQLPAKSRRTRTPTKPKPTSCETCSKSFSSAATYQRHKLTQHGAGQSQGRQKYTCDRDLCSKTYLSKHHLARHQRSAHDKIKSHTCAICAQTFSRRQYLEQHVLTHSETRPYKCGICPATFRQRQGLQGHTSKHFGSLVSRQLCTHCGQLFTTKDSLRKHVRHIHGRIREHSCPICRKAFKTRPSLNYHVGTHLHPRPNARPRGLNADQDDGCTRLKQIGGRFKVQQVVLDAGIIQNSP